MWWRIHCKTGLIALVYGGEIVMVGINYNEKTKVHSCKIEKDIMAGTESGV